MWADWIETYGYIVVFLGCVLEGELILILAGYSIARGYLEIGPTLLLAVAGATAGDSLYYWIGRRFGSRLSRGEARLRPIRARAALALRKWGRATAFLTRFAYGLRIALPMLIGASRMRPTLFHLFNLLGAAAFVGLYLGLGILFGEAVDDLVVRIRIYEARLLLTIIVLGTIVWIVREWRIHRIPPKM